MTWSGKLIADIIYTKGKKAITKKFSKLYTQTPFSLSLSSTISILEYHSSQARSAFRTNNIITKRPNNASPATIKAAPHQILTISPLNTDYQAPAIFPARFKFSSANSTIATTITSQAPLGTPSFTAVSQSFCFPIEYSSTILVKQWLERPSNLTSTPSITTKNTIATLSAISPSPSSSSHTPLPQLSHHSSPIIILPNTSSSITNDEPKSSSPNVAFPVPITPKYINSIIYYNSEFSVAAIILSSVRGTFLTNHFIHLIIT
ncbi:hypothetical protein CONCODRAFT_5966 [Conidiobolus coronatus NRRL 28638]|uniref:Uncharacterized protein n=1 Tax=Conidiobolus coronatus (strain ATCC 28846 / CBS 209.66 / NRRL 28638) TaxID=796925 RepID=A0A137P8I9_CONC2|nr:hypothetical protein CONCODRAFT_5966 [Conidiobolus coronatus NRRL 28638]|eukprot:KXN71327.1 hypothetical protein CONCODRAFT_5966 [Conidiobolus coronatus NRRL 28638]